MRVIAGEFGGRNLIAPEGLATRPTTDKVRQAVFNSLGSRGVIEGATVVDLFAGSGALGIEALSRGAESCVFVERDRAALSALRTNIDTLGLASRTQIVRGDVASYLATMPDVDIALIDPPYEFTDWGDLLGAVRAGLVVAESGRELERILDGQVEGWEILRAKRHGRTVVTTLERLP